MSRVLSDPTDFCRLYLFRHPELSQDHQNAAVGAGAAELSRRGRATVLEWRALLDGVELDAVVTSPQPQCLEPAQALVQDRELEVTVEERLRDQELGEWQGQSWEQVAKADGERVRRFFQEFGESPAPGGESLGQTVERVIGWWTESAPRLAGKSLALVLAEGPLTGFTAALLGMRLSRCFSLRMPPGALGVLDVYENGVQLAAWNATALQS